MQADHEFIPTIGTYSKDSDSLFMAMHLSMERYGFASLDCAPRYGNLEQVAIAIRRLSPNRERMRITSKINTAQQEQSTVGESVREDIEDIGANYLDCYLIHSSRYPAFPTTWQKMNAVKRSGLIREVGVANFEYEELAMLPGPYPAVMQVSSLQYYSGRCPRPSSSLRIEVYGLISFFSRLPDCSKAVFSSLCSKMGLGVDEGILISSAHEGVIPVLGTSKQERLARQFEAYDRGFDQQKTGEVLSKCLRSLYA